MRILRGAVLFAALVACSSLLFGQGAQAQEQQPTSSQPAPAAQPPSGPQPQKPATGTLKMADYTKPRTHFPNPIAPYIAKEVPEAFLGNTPRVDQLVQNGRLMLSLNDAIALALENNLDLAIARFNMNIADTDILRTKAGAATRGVATGLVQGTPGGGVGGFGTGAQ